ncbi:divalent-cation tolerance protein CutA [Halothiobacillus sp. DCM-1]|uniref:divalent-cation tolerance protein CutA n=1 Tax=Halothiobacillus sp. DCM-1 TaxID=3112558 RepID=UPI0032556A62
MTSRELILLMTTLPDTASAERIAATLVEQKLAACVQILPPGQSIYEWGGQVTRAEECLLLVKTLLSHQERAVAALLAAHPYQLPELIGMRPDYVSPAYQDWVAQTLAAV